MPCRCGPAAASPRGPAGRADGRRGRPLSIKRPPGGGPASPARRAGRAFPPPRAARKPASASSSRWGNRSTDTAGSWGPRPGASSPESCMTQMPDSPYSANWISPSSRAKRRLPSHRLTAPRARRPARGFQHSGVPAAQRGQAGVKGLYPAAGPPGQGGAEASGAELGGGTAPQGADHVLGRQELALAFPLCLDGVAAPFLAQLQHPAAGLHRHAQRLQPAQQQAGQIRRLVGIGIQPPCLIGPVEQAQPLPPGRQVRPVDGGQQPGQRAGGRSEIPPPARY